MRPLAFVPAVLALIPVIAPGPALADIYDEAEIEVTPYEVTGASLDEVQEDMEANGPNGFWAYTSWNTRWDGQCNITVTARITMPELAEDAPLSDDDRAEFERMADALLDHELGHVRFGVAFGDEVRAAGCPRDTKATHQRWLQQERDYDDETGHGLQQGAYLAK